MRLQLTPFPVKHSFNKSMSMVDRFNRALTFLKKNLAKAEIVSFLCKSNRWRGAKERAAPKSTNKIPE